MFKFSFFVKINSLLDEKIIDAILYKTGEAGRILDIIRRYERWDVPAYELEQWLPMGITQFYLQSIEWSNQVLNHAH